MVEKSVDAENLMMTPLLEGRFASPHRKQETINTIRMQHGRWKVPVSVRPQTSSVPTSPYEQETLERGNGKERKEGKEPQGMNCCVLTFTSETGPLPESLWFCSSGWWFCQCDTKRGWAPASYLEPLDQPDEAEDVEPDYEGELFIATQAYKAEQEDEISLELGETITVIHKLLDGWWVVRKGEETGHFPSMYLQKAGKREQQEAGRTNPQRQKLPPRRSSITNSQGIHNKSRKKLSQDAYRRNSRRYLQQKGGRLTEPHRNSKRRAKSPLNEKKNQDNIPELSGSGSESEVKREAPVVPPRPSPELILSAATDNTRNRVSIKSHSDSSS
ncbi:LOW QUALITY PROTEIN: neutrophil cytosol factor 1 [Hippoglossus hippoglossus]|uniref:LOW QUALITY PROTEIN: neutrophil cytosol factor 1 n=1 Tax=Hippoglossus hippoglossus TaxID=8267 RepID=UPI00148E0D0A|nr:LOW QUALITY PROTEIN: neutrophil cytosol factor 1 [Hippoglossus hippoglossus]